MIDRICTLAAFYYMKLYPVIKKEFVFGVKHKKCLSSLNIYIISQKDKKIHIFFIFSI